MSQRAAGGCSIAPPPQPPLTLPFHPLPLLHGFWGWCWHPRESRGFRSPPMALESEHWLELNCLGPRRRGAGKIWGLRTPGRCPGKPCRRHTWATGNMESKDALEQGELCDEQSALQTRNRLTGQSGRAPVTMVTGRWPGAIPLPRTVALPWSLEQPCVAGRLAVRTKSADWPRAAGTPVARSIQGKPEVSSRQLTTL